MVLNEVNQIKNNSCQMRVIMLEKRKVFENYFPNMLKNFKEFHAIQE